MSEFASAVGWTCGAGGCPTIIRLLVRGRRFQIAPEYVRTPLMNARGFRYGRHAGLPEGSDYVHVGTHRRSPALSRARCLWHGADECLTSLAETRAANTAGLPCSARVYPPAQCPAARGPWPTRRGLDRPRAAHGKTRQRCGVQDCTGGGYSEQHRGSGMLAHRKFSINIRSELSFTFRG